jgi:hypothetical protein
MGGVAGRRISLPSAAKPTNGLADFGNFRGASGRNSAAEGNFESCSI